MRTTQTDLYNADEDDARQWTEQGGIEARARSETDREPCPCCMAYNRPGMIYNAGQWMRCPMCNPTSSATARPAPLLTTGDRP